MDRIAFGASVVVTSPFANYVNKAIYSLAAKGFEIPLCDLCRISC